MTEEPVARPHPEPVILDIGGDIGALVVYGASDQIDTPIEVSLTGDDDARFHQHILERPMADGTMYAAVFDRVTQGEYSLWIHGESCARNVAVTGGAVAEVDLR